MMECKIVALAIKLLPLSFANAIIWCNKSNFSNKNLSYTTMELLICFIHLKQPHNNMHGDPCFIQKIDNQNKSIHTTMRHLKIKTSRNYCCKYKIQ
jgi:hypothetical protein